MTQEVPFQQPNNLNITFNNGILKICVLNAWPSMQDLIDACSIQKTPSFFPNIQWPDLSGIYEGAALLSEVIKQMLLGVIDQLLKLIPGFNIAQFFANLQAAWEQLIGFFIDIKDVVEGKIAAVTAAVTAYVEEMKEKLRMGFKITLPAWLNLNIFDKFSNFGVEIAHIINELMNNFYAFALKSLADLINPILNTIRSILSMLPSIPTIPSFAAIKQMLKDEIAKFAGEINFGEKLKKAWDAFVEKVCALMNLDGVLAPLRALIKLIKQLPNPLMKNFSIPDIEIEIIISDFMKQIVKCIIDFIADYIIQPIMDVIDAIRELLGNIIALIWPLPGIFPICISIPVVPVAAYALNRKYNVIK